MTTIKNENKKIDLMWKYVIFTYLFFWIMVLGLGGTAAMILKVSPLTMRLVALLCAWSPTIVFILMFKKLKPDTDLKKYVKNMFSQKLGSGLIVLSGLAVVGGVLLPVKIISFAAEQNFSSFFSLRGYSLPAAVLLSFFAGPAGEELGWRGYLRTELDKKYSFLKASITGGVIWAFWHAVLWLVDADFTGWALIVYIVSNVVVMTSIVIIMNVVLKRSNNLLNAVWIHFCFNLPYSFLINADIWFFVILSIVYIFIGWGFLAYHQIDVKRVIDNS